MAIISCPECGKDISNKARTCPNCGYPISEISNLDEAVDNEHVDSLGKHYSIDKLDYNYPIEKMRIGNKRGSFELFGETLWFTDACFVDVLYHKIKDNPPHLYRNIAKRISKEYIEKYSTLEEFVQQTPRVFEASINLLMNLIMDEINTLCSGTGITSNDIHSFIGKALEYYDIELQFPTLALSLENGLNNVEYSLEMQKFYRTLRKDSRGRVGFFANSAKGFAKGMVETTAINAAFGAIHSGVNAIGNVKDELKVLRNKQDLLLKIKKEGIAEQALSADLEAFELMAREGVCFWCQCQENFEPMQEIRDIASFFTQNIKEEKDMIQKKKYLLLAIQGTPFNHNLYKCIMENFPKEYIEARPQYEKNIYSVIGIPVHYEKTVLRKHYFGETLYPTPEAAKEAEKKYIESCTYKGKRYDNPNRAQQAKAKDEKYEREYKLAQSIVNTVNIENPQTIRDAKNKLESTRWSEYTPTEEKILINDFINEYDYLVPWKKIQEIDFSSKEYIVGSAMPLLADSYQRATEAEKQVLREQLYNILSPVIEENTKQINESIEHCEKEMNHFANLFEARKNKVMITEYFNADAGLYSLFIGLLGGSFILSLVCLIRFFMSIGKAWLVSNFLLVLFVIITIAIARFIFEDILNGKYTDYLDDISCKRYQPIWSNLNRTDHAKRKIKTLQERITDMTNMLKKINCTNVPNIPNIPLDTNTTIQQQQRKSLLETDKKEDTIVYAIYHGFSILVCILCCLLIIPICSQRIPSKAEVQQAKQEEQAQKQKEEQQAAEQEQAAYNQKMNAWKDQVYDIFDNDATEQCIEKKEAKKLVKKFWYNQEYVLSGFLEDTKYYFNEYCRTSQTGNEITEEPYQIYAVEHFKKEQTIFVYYTLNGEEQLYCDTILYDNGKTTEWTSGVKVN